MNDLEGRLAELLKAGVGDPPSPITVHAVRHRMARRRVATAWCAWKRPSWPRHRRRCGARTGAASTARTTAPCTPRAPSSRPRSNCSQRPRRTAARPLAPRTRLPSSAGHLRSLPHCPAGPGPAARPGSPLRSRLPAGGLTGSAMTRPPRSTGSWSHLWRQLTGGSVIGVATAENAAQSARRRRRRHRVQHRDVPDPELDQPAPASGSPAGGGRGEHGHHRSADRAAPARLQRGCQVAADRRPGPAARDRPGRRPVDDHPPARLLPAHHGAALDPVVGTRSLAAAAGRRPDGAR